VTEAEKAIPPSKRGKVSTLAIYLSRFEPTIAHEVPLAPPVRVYETSHGFSLVDVTDYAARYERPRSHGGAKARIERVAARTITRARTLRDWRGMPVAYRPRTVGLAFLPDLDRLAVSAAWVPLTDPVPDRYSHLWEHDLPETPGEFWREIVDTSARLFWDYDEDGRYVAARDGSVFARPLRDHFDDRRVHALCRGPLPTFRVDTFTRPVACMPEIYLNHVRGLTDAPHPRRVREVYVRCLSDPRPWAEELTETVRGLLEEL
jgi:hypothetical protein